jgi:hypothetical protein
MAATVLAAATAAAATLFRDGNFSVLLQNLVAHKVNRHG